MKVQAARGKISLLFFAFLKAPSFQVGPQEDPPPGLLGRPLVHSTIHLTPTCPESYVSSFTGSFSTCELSSRPHGDWGTGVSKLRKPLAQVGQAEGHNHPKPKCQVSL